MIVERAPFLYPYLLTRFFTMHSHRAACGGAERWRHFSSWMATEEHWPTSKRACMANRSHIGASRDLNNRKRSHDFQQHAPTAPTTRVPAGMTWPAN